MRPVGLAFAPHRRVHGEARLPLLQRLTPNITAQTKASMLTQDSLRIGNPQRCYGNLAPVQIFALNPDPGQTLPNSPANMRPGLRLTNARAAGGRGQSAGM